jgi:hypothetical protein
MFTKEKIKPENSLLQPHKETTLEKQQKRRQDKKTIQAEAVSGKDDILNRKMNERMKRKAMIQAQFNKFEPDMA